MSISSTEVNEVNLIALQKEVGDSPKFSIIKCENWGQSRKTQLVFTVKPTTVEEVQIVVRAARRCNLKVRAVENIQIWSSLYPDEANILIDGTGLTSHNGEKIYENEVGPHGRKTVTIISAIDMQELIDFFNTNKLCFPSSVVFPVVTCSGIMSTECYGMGRNKLSDWITAATVVDSKGNIHKFEQKGHDVEMIKAIQASLGMFAIFISLTMKVQDQFFVRVDHLFQSLESFFFDPKHLRKFINQNSFVKMVWIPYNGMELEYLNPWHATVTGKFCWNPLSDKLWVKAINQYKRGSSELDLQQVRKLHQSFPIFGNMIHICKELQFSDKLHCIHNDLSDVKKIVDIQLFQHPLLLYITFKAITDQYSKTIGIRESIMDAIHCRSYKDLVPLYNMSFVFNCPNTKEGFYNACKAITRVVQLVQMNSVEGKDPLAISLEMRWIPQSDILLAPAIATKPNSYTLYLEILSFENTDYTQAFFIKVANYWKTLECEGVKPMYIPHWGKQWKMIPQTSHYSYEVYDHDEAMKQLKDICDLDPNNVLINETSFDHQMSIVLE